MSQFDPKNFPGLLPQHLPVSMPMAAPGPGGMYNRYREMTLEEMLLENRVIFLIGEINHGSAARVYMQMLYLQSQKRDADINLYINSPGGNVTDTLAVIDVMRFLSCDVATYCIGECASGGAVILMAGKKGKRFILPNAKVMIHQPFGGVYGQAADIEIQAEEILKEALAKDPTNELFSRQNRFRLDTRIPKARGQGKGLNARLERLLVLTDQPEVVRLVGDDLHEPAVIPEPTR
jgi:ATP-dependent Clp protease protease subunit